MKLPLNFLDRWENSIFGKYNPERPPMSSGVAKLVLFVACALVVIAFVMQMFGAKEAFTVVSNIVFGATFFYVVYLVYNNIKFLPSVGSKIGFSFYMLMFFGICFSVFVTLASYALMLVLIVLVGVLILYLMGGGDSKSKKGGRVHYSDGSSEEIEETGRGILGERYYKGKDTGNTFQE